MIGRHNFVRLSFVAALTVAFTALLLPQFANAQPVSKTGMAGQYSVNLKVLPAEAFMGPHQSMVRDGGAMAAAMNGAEHPNHHLVVFIRKNDKPVEQANVSIHYRMGSGGGHWMSLPVSRMYVKGEGKDTTHFGNNVMLESGSYEVKVEVNGKTAIFHFSL